MKILTSPFRYRVKSTKLRKCENCKWIIATGEECYKWVGAGKPLYVHIDCEKNKNKNY